LAPEVAGLAPGSCGQRSVQANVTSVVLLKVTGQDRCHDFLNIFAEKFCENIGVFD
jgi:hypothetical protein